MSSILRWPDSVHTPVDDIMFSLFVLSLNYRGQHNIVVKEGGNRV